MMRTSVMKRMTVSLSVIALGATLTGAARAGDYLVLKTSRTLSVINQPIPEYTTAKKIDPGLLAKVPLFRGVKVDESPRHATKSTQSKIKLDDSENQALSMVKAVYGGLQISLKENLSLVYAPGRLSGNSMNSESQGLYLLANRGGVANWFVGVESRSSNLTAESRRSANTARFGVVMNLD
ncbi:hypothetical protein [Limnobacter parvus]|uniref:Uncharacterized protein n=1 Tax=Limnobacter parvus TaxID=2939690 RepID=A0ABT1XIB1_9BURK|nr:hypothetical protein [Limnobacter parvus]MCR2747028.1 hypothetical protein [Limnobacter parvus]